MNVIPSVLMTLAVTLAANANAQQNCINSIKASTPMSRFIFDDKAGTVTDRETKITWMRCALGQTWNGATCTGEATTLSWTEARERVAQINSDTFGEPLSWRLPYLPELASIVERQCFEPRVNQAVFPATPSQVFWSNMQVKDKPEQIYTMDFGMGSIKRSHNSSVGAIRLMKYQGNERWWRIKKVSND